MSLNILKSRLKRTYDVNIRDILLWEQLSIEERYIIQKNTTWLDEEIEICSRPKLYPESVVITNSTFYFINEVNFIFSINNDRIKGASASLKQIHYLPKDCNLMDIHIHPDIIYELEVQQPELLWGLIEILKYLAVKIKVV